MSHQELIFAAIRAERKAQDDRWGAEHDPGDGFLLAVLVEELGEVARELNEPWPAPAIGRLLRSELVQVAAVAVAWLETLERRQGSERESGIR
jgi:hypothetical protein